MIKVINIGKILQIRTTLDFQMVAVCLQLVAEMEPVIRRKSVVIEVEMRVVNVQEGMEFAVFVSSNKFLDAKNIPIWDKML